MSIEPAHVLRGTHFRAAIVVPNASIENAYLSYRDLRSRRVVELGWREIDDLTDGVDIDLYDDFHAQTKSIILVDDHEEALGGARITIQDGPIETSLSFTMWGGQAALSGKPAETAEFRASYDAGELFDLTRLLCEQGLETPGNVLAIIGAGVAATGASMGSYFTVGAKLARLLRLSGIETRPLHTGRLGPDSAALLWVPKTAWAHVAYRRARVMLTRGAVAYDPELATSMPFYEPTSPPEPEPRGAKRVETVGRTA